MQSSMVNTPNILLEKVGDLYMKRIIIAIIVWMLFIFASVSLLSTRAGATKATFDTITICHHTPGNDVTLTFHTPQAYLGHLGTPHSGQTYDSVGACSQPSVTPSITPTIEVTPTPSIEPSVTPEVTPTEEPRVTPTDEPKGNGGTPPTFAGSSTEAQQCGDTDPTKTGANFHIYRNGQDAIAKWLPTEGNRVHIYYVNIHDASDIHALRDVKNDGYEDNLHLLGSKDWRFGLQQAQGCAAGPIVWVDDGATDQWILFR
jgi:hypothetical protein